MPRKKNASRTTAKKSLSATQKIERSLLEVPAKLAAILDKEVISLKKKEDSLKQAIKKTTGKCEKQEKQLKAAEKAKATPAAKKKLMVLKKTHQATLQALKALENTLREAATNLDAAKQNQLKASALRKHIIQFEKDWVQQANKTKRAAKAIVKEKKMKQAKKTAPTKQPMITNMSEEAAHQAEYDHFDITATHNEMDEKSNLN